MPDLLQAIKNLYQSVIDDEPKQPLHIGEAMSCWLYLTMLAEARIYEQAALNTTTDNELRSSLIEALGMCEKHIEIVRDFMRQEGVPLAELSEPRPLSDASAVPLGVKLTADEIANGVSVKTVSGILHCATASAQSIRSDVGMMFTRFQLEMITFASTQKALMRKRGWMKYPPHYVPPGSPVH